MNKRVSITSLILDFRFVILDLWHGFLLREYGYGGQAAGNLNCKSYQSCSSCRIKKPLPLSGKKLNLFFVALWLCAIPCDVACFAQEVKPQAWPTVGIEAGVTVELVRGDLVALGIKERTDLILRIASVKPGADGFDYELRYIGLLPGDYNLADYLMTPEGYLAESLPLILVKVLPLLPQGHQGELVSSQLKAHTPPGGYKLFFSGIWLFWALLLVPLIFVGRVKKTVEVVIIAPPPTLEEQLRPLVEKALGGGLDVAEKEHLERLLMGYWQQKLNCDEATAYLMLKKIKEDPEGGQLIAKLEDWLHRPPGTEPVALGEMLARYAHLTEQPEEKVGTP